MQIKLDELIRATTKADNSLLNLEELEEHELEALRSDYERLADKARETLQRRRTR
jgi:low affinity Fe/Cu permease